MFIVNGKTDPPYNNKWVLGGCETVCKSGCFDRVTLSDDDGRCNHSFSTARAGTRRPGFGRRRTRRSDPRPWHSGYRPAGQIGPPLLSERPKERVPPAACRSRRQSFECVRQPSSQHGRRRPCTTFWARTPVHQLILDTQSGNTMVVLNPNQNSTSTSEAASRMSAQYLSSLYVQPLPHEVSC